MPNPQPSYPTPSAADVRRLVYDWYGKLDVHAPVAKLLPALAETAKLILPETTLEGLEAFTAWYQGGSAAFDLPGVINIFFDERHELRRVDISIIDGAEPWRAEVGIVVRWEARRWKPPASRSDYLAFDAWQRWVVGQHSRTGQPVIQEYIVDALEPLQGSAAL